ncbi:MAG: S-layer homology domain-containing protein [Clostridia bacterium]|nr:S-layer homology domain-containing protein [Clostridia bacterium]
MRKIICLMLACMLLLPAINISASTYDDYGTATLLKELGIMQGDPDGNLRLDDYVTRAEFSKIAITASSYKNTVAKQSAISPFKDVSYKHWAAPFVSVAVKNGVITGYPDFTFRPEQNVTYEEAVTVCLKLLGYTSEDYGVSWPYGQVGMAENLNLDENVTANVGDNMTRRNVMNLVYNMLNTCSKNTDRDYISVFDYTIVEDCVLIATSKEDSSVGGNKINTSEGTYNISSDFNRENVGKKGDAVLKDNKDLVIFVPYNQQVTAYNIYQILDNKVIVYENGKTMATDIDTSISVYNKGSKSTLSAMLNQINPGDILTTYKNSEGVLDYGILNKDTLEGPIIAYSNEWYKSYGLDIGNYTVIKDGTKSTANSISRYDVVYYSKALNTVYAYSKKVTGVYESASPNKDMPTLVTVSGVTYKLEGASAYNSLSSQGVHNYGDTVTLLLGRNGDVAGVLEPKEAVGIINGYLKSTGIKQFSTADGNTISSNCISIVRADGTSADFRTNVDYSNFINKIVTVSFNNDGIASIAVRNDSGSIYGVVDANNNYIGKNKISPNVQILDISGTKAGEPTAYTKTYMSRIDGIELESGDVIYYSKNSDGEISELFLNNVTGDMYIYGIVTSSQLNTAGSVKTFNCLANWNSYSYKGATISGVSVKTGGGVGILLDGNSAVEYISLKQLSASVDDISGDIIKTKKGDYVIYGNASAFVKSGNSYMQTDLNEVTDLTKYNITAYYDKEINEGGRIRVLVAVKKD